MALQLYWCQRSARLMPDCNAHFQVRIALLVATQLQIWWLFLGTLTLALHLTDSI